PITIAKSGRRINHLQRDLPDSEASVYVIGMSHPTSRKRAIRPTRASLTCPKTSGELVTL
ncbi:MAG: hypothetical protein WCD29_10255, partial [Pseudolabrys sp.]